jgi:hypothetical protein
VSTREPPEPLLVSDRAAGLGPFVGPWYHHGAHLTLRSDGRATQEVTENGVGSAVETFRWTRYRHPDRLVLVLTDAYRLDLNGRRTPAPSPGLCQLALGETRPGDTYLLRLEDPHLAEVIPLVSHQDQDANDAFYWCQDPLPGKYEDPKYCGL